MNVKLTENEYRLHKIGRKNAKDVNKYFRQFYDLFRNQPERLNPEDYIENKLEMVCDSPNSENK